MSSLEKNCTLLLAHESDALPKMEDLKSKLESKDDNVKIEALKTIISHIVNGDNLNNLLMHVIKFCLHSENHTIKKLLLLFWEVVQKTNSDGSLLPEMILVCNAMKNNLNHPNEYIRGATLRFLCHMKLAEILESLIPYISLNLEHRHSYVRKNAVLAVFSVYESFPDLLSDAPELIEKFLYSESNASAKRNAFLMLYHCDEERARTYLESIAQISSTDENFQLVALELMRKLARSNPSLKASYLRVIFAMSNSPSNAVAFEAANTLVSLSSAPTAIRASVGAYCRLLSAESDPNIKLVILDRILPLKKRHPKLLQELLMDILRTLSSPNIDIRRKLLTLTLDLVSQRNVDEVVSLLKKELIKTESPEQGKEDEYRKLLVDVLHKVAIKFPDVVGSVVQLLMNYLGDDNSNSALDVIYFVREIVEEYPALRDDILSKLMENFEEIKTVEVYRYAVWILGEYATGSGVVDAALETVHTAVGELPLLKPPVDEDADDEQDADAGNTSKKGAKGPRVLADGTYASQSASTERPDQSAAGGAPAQSIRAFIIDGNYFLASCLANALTKMLLRFATLVGYGSPESNQQIAKGLLLLTSILRLGTSPHAKKKIDPDSAQRIHLCIRTLLNPKDTSDIFLKKCRDAFSAMIQSTREESKEQKEETEVLSQADDVISIRQLKGVQVAMDDLDDDMGSDLSRAVTLQNKQGDNFAERLRRVHQLTGFADPVYAEAYLTVLDYDIVLDILVVNQTRQVLQGLQVELSTSRDLRVMERPQSHNIAPFDMLKIQANIKVSSTESGVIFGNITYNSSSGSDKTIVVLNSIHMDIVDYIQPATCSELLFRSMWAEFEWENKVAVNTDIRDISAYLSHILKITNMKCLTQDSQLKGSSGFLAANLYARSIFGEDALLNLSVEKVESGPQAKVHGYIRIRSKSQGIALSLGDKITNYQRTTS